MKTRNDFVSNSSSSSFLIADNCMFDLFNLSKQDIEDALTALISKDVLAKLTAERKETLKRLIESYSKPFKSKDNNDVEWRENYANSMKKELASLENGESVKLFYVYDLHDATDRNDAYKSWDSILSDWTARRGDNAAYALLNRAFNNAGLQELEYINFGQIEDMTPDDDCWPTIFNAETKKTEKIPEYVVKALQYIRKQMGIQTNKDVLHSNDTRFFIHFDENDIYYLSGMSDCGKEDINEYATEEENRKCKSSEFDSCSYSSMRFYEILIKQLVKMGKIDLADPKLLEYWKITDEDRKNAWIAKDYEGKEYFLKDQTKASWKEIVDDMFEESSCIHEG